jgi:hypothetical protein
VPVQNSGGGSKWGPCRFGSSVGAGADVSSHLGANKSGAGCGSLTLTAQTKIITGMMAMVDMRARIGRFGHLPPISPPDSLRAAARHAQVGAGFTLH